MDKMAADVLAFMPTRENIVRLCTRRRCRGSRPAIFMIDSKEQKLLTAKVAEKSRQVRLQVLFVAICLEVPPLPLRALPHYGPSSPHL
ncbi:MAG: hypothetical protein DMG83_14170 [Acidobacteria bacterium]|nr:MAG: hypothetical protein DMG83_14170 [Acidobacteriota bacterium]